VEEIMTVAQQVLSRSDEATMDVDRTVAIREILNLAITLDYEESVVDALLALGRSWSPPSTCGS